MGSLFKLEKLIRDNVKKMQPYSSARSEFKESKKGYVYLDANENPFGNSLNRYPDPQQTELKKILSEIKRVSIGNILVGNGSDEVLDLIIRAFCEPKEDNIVILPPTYGMYKVLADLNDVVIKAINLTSEFQPQLDKIFNAVDDNSKLMFICSPNNPTGNDIEVEAIEQLLIKFEGLVIIDEAYIDFSTKPSWINRLDEFPNLIVTQTMSKAYGMAGIRMGLCYASKEIISVLNKIKPPYNVNELSQIDAQKKLNEAKSVNKQISRIISERQKLYSELEKISFVKKVYASDANFILVKVDDANVRYSELINKGIVVRNRTNQPLCENCIRITVGTEEENKRLLDQMVTLS